MPSQNQSETEELNTPTYWLNLLEPGAVFIDYDGWKGRDAKPFGTPISKEEFQSRLSASSVMWTSTPEYPEEKTAG